MTRIGTKAAVLVALCLVWTVAISADLDLSRLPEDPHKMAAALSAAKIDLAAAIKRAEGEVSGGKASRAEMMMSNGRLVATIAVLSKDKAFMYQIDTGSGSVIEKKELAMTTYGLPGEAVSGEPTKTGSGLEYYEIKTGSGEPVASPQQVISFHTTVYLVDGKKAWSSRDTNQPVTGSYTRLVPGVQEGLKGMMPGGKRKLLVPYNLGYGERGNPPAIPAKAMLIFDVELLSVQK